MHQATATPFRSLHVQRPENLGSDDEAGLHTTQGRVNRVAGILCWTWPSQGLRARVRVQSLITRDFI